MSFEHREKNDCVYKLFVTDLKYDSDVLSLFKDKKNWMELL